MAISLLEKANIPFEKIDAEEEVSLTKKMEVKQAPTLAIVSDDEVTKIVNLSNIKKYVESVNRQYV